MRKLLLCTAMSLTLSAALFSTQAMAAIYQGNEACQKLVQEGDALEKALKMTEALHAYEEAAKADPASSLPYSRMATLYFFSSEHTSKDLAKQYRERARSTAQQALAIESNDPYAHDVLLKLEEGDKDPLKDVPPEALAEFAQAEQAYRDKRYEDAIGHYRKSIELYPRFDVAYVYLGDGYYSTARFAEAEKNYRQALAINPSNAQALRFLGDALFKQGKIGEIKPVLISAITQKPNEMPSWDHLENFLKTQGTVMQRFNYRQRASYDAQNKKMNLDTNGPNQPDPFATVIWIGYGMAHATIEDKSASAFAQELTAWTKAMTIADELAQKNGSETADPALLLLRRFYHDGQLKQALLLLTFHESYRAEFEAWKKEDAEGIAKFIDTYHVRP